MPLAEFVALDWQERQVDIEYQWVGERNPAAPLVVFLHEGLGSREMWKDFPHNLCTGLGWRGLVYSRPGYGRSTMRAADESWGVDFMHRQACEVLPRLFDRLDIDTLACPPCLFGHSDGASIALLYAAHYPRHVAALMLLAPHIRVEQLSIDSIERARVAYLESDLRDRLARYHDDPDSPFHGWNEAWLNPEFRHWSIEEEVDAIECPVLAVQGVDDEYGTLEQVRGIARRLPQTEVVELPDCGHSPHRDQPRRLLEIVHTFAETRLPGSYNLKLSDFEG